MQKRILIKYGELTTKKDNRKLFIEKLYQNILAKLKDKNILIEKEYSRMYIDYDSLIEDEVITVLKNTFGIHEFEIAYKVNTNIEKIKDNILISLKNRSFKTFKVETKRRDKSFEITSTEFSKMLGGYILKNIEDVKVDVHNPDLLLNVEINKESTYFYFNAIKGLGGYPVGVQGKGFLMLSGGIDSPVAGYLALKRGVSIDAIYFEAIPHTSLQAREKVIKLARKLLAFTPKINLYVVPITKLQEAIYKNCDPTYIITILRRMMYRIASQIALKNHGKILINGESIGQVASQTLSSMQVINEVVNIPVIRPVACMDKLEIIKIAKEIKTYDISILPYEDCCTIFVPRHPVINPSLKKAQLEEAKINYEAAIQEILKETFIIKITEEKEEFADLL